MRHGRTVMRLLLIAAGIDPVAQADSWEANGSVTHPGIQTSVKQASGARFLCAYARRQWPACLDA